jgi:hypothetical protein
MIITLVRKYGLFDIHDVTFASQCILKRNLILSITELTKIKASWTNRNVAVRLSDWATSRTTDVLATTAARYIQTHTTHSDHTQSHTTHTHMYTRGRHKESGDHSVTIM